MQFGTFLSLLIFMTLIGASSPTRAQDTALPANLCETTFAMKAAGDSKSAEFIDSLREAIAKTAAEVTDGTLEIKTKEDMLALWGHARMLFNLYGITTSAFSMPELPNHSGTSPIALQIKADPTSFLGLIAGHVEKRGYKLVVYLSPGLAGFVGSNGIKLFGLSLNSALEITRGDIQSMSTVIHELTHLRNYDLVNNPNPSISERGRTRAANFDATNTLPLPGAEEACGYGKFFGIDEFEAYESELRWILRRSLSGKLSRPLTGVPREFFSETFESLQVLSKMSAQISPLLQKLALTLTQVENPFSDSRTTHFIAVTKVESRGNFGASIRVLEAGSATLGKRAFQVTFSFLTTENKLNDHFTLEIPMPENASLKIDSAKKTLGQALANLTNAMANYQRRADRIVSIYGNANPEVPFTDTDIQSLLNP